MASGSGYNATASGYNVYRDNDVHAGCHSNINERVKQGSGTFELYALPQSNSTTGAIKVGEGFSVTDTNYLVFNNDKTVTLKVNNLTLLGGHRYGVDSNHYVVKWGSSNVQDMEANNLEQVHIRRSGQD